MDYFNIFVALVMGVSLSAACGFRVFVPLLVAGLAVRFGGVQVGESLQWISGDVALVGLGVATVVEILAYYIPAVDNLLDTVSVPLAAIAGTVLTGGMLADMPDAMQWTLAVVAGGGVAGTVSGTTAAVRAASTGATVGLGNPVVSTVENGCATVGAGLALFMPLVAGVGVILLGVLVFWAWHKLLAKRRETAEPAA